MSDPVANVEIEDVLTSIRRLVSESGRPAGTRETRSVLSEAVMPSTAPDAEPEALDRLVLTPAQRIPEVEEAASEEEGPELLLHPVAQPDPAPLIEEDEEEVQAEGEAQIAEFLAEESEAEDAFDPDEGITLSDAQAMDSRIVRWETLNPEEQSELVEPDSPGDSDYAGTDVRGLSWIEPLGEVAEETAEEEAELEAVVEAEEAEEASLEPEGIEMPSFLRSATEEAEEPEATEAFEPVEPADYDSEPVELRDETFDEDPLETVVSSVEAEATAYVQDSVEEAIAPELDNFDQDDTVMLDETMLRELVSDIVRQELQGALGERITRNVRKLVRREIHRALAAHDLE